MKRTNKCPKCGSADIIADARAVDRGHLNAQNELIVATFRSPNAFLFKGQASTAVSAWVCTDCGYVELYADAPKTLR